MRWAAFNSFLNELAYKPKGSKQSYLFYLSWLNHNLNANFNLTDAGGPLLRGTLMLSCNASRLAYALAPRPSRICRPSCRAPCPRPRGNAPDPRRPEAHRHSKVRT